MGGRRNGEDGVRESGPTEGGVVVGADGECVGGVGVPAAAGECVFEWNCGRAIGGYDNADGNELGGGRAGAEVGAAGEISECSMV
jgi:hypothetical protein